MAKKRCWALAGLLLGLLLSMAPETIAGQDERLVLAFYYAWFDQQTWEMDLPDRPLQTYHSADVSAIQRHVKQARDAGIDALVQAWYGPTMENNQTEANFQILLDQALTHGLKAAVAVDMGGDFLQTEDEVLLALQSVRDDHALHPRYLHVDGQPVVFFWKQENFSTETWASIRDQVDPTSAMLWIAEGDRQDDLAVFDGLYLYSVAWTEEPADVLVEWGATVRQWRANHNSFRYWVATVMPGYNDLVTGRGDAFVRERDDGAFYRACWEGAVQSAADWVVITSFNEWLEGTYIEPSVNYGDTYLALTQELASEYRAASFEPTPTATPYVTPTATAVLTTVTPTATLTPTATVAFSTATPTATPTLTPTDTPIPTATPFRLSTPTPTMGAAATPAPTSLASPAPTSAGAPEPGAPPGVPAITATPPRRRTMMPVEGGPPRTRCALMPAALSSGVVLLVLHRRREDLGE